MSESIRYPRFRWLVLMTASLGFAAMQINMIAYAPLLGDIAKDLGIDTRAGQMMKENNTTDRIMG